MPIDEPFEYLSFGATFWRVFTLYADRFDVFMSLAAVVLVPFAILTITLAIFIASVAIREEEIPDFHPRHVPLVVLILTIQWLAYTFVTIIGRGAMIRAAALMYVGQRPTWMSCLKSAWEKKWSLLGANLLVYAALFGGLVIPWVLVSVAAINPNVLTVFLACVAGLVFVVGGIYGYVGVVLTNPAIMVENISNPSRGIQRSWELATGSRCYILCALFCLWFINNMVSRLLHNMFVTGDVMDVLFSMAGIVVSVIPLLIFFPLHSIMETVMYLNLRIGRESMNHQVLSADLMSDAEASSRFRNDDTAVSASGPSMDYRHVPLMDEEEQMAPLNTLPPQPTEQPAPSPSP